MSEPTRPAPGPESEVVAPRSEQASPAVAASGLSSAAQLLALQRSAGNAGVSRWLDSTSNRSGRTLSRSSSALERDDGVIADQLRATAASRGERRLLRQDPVPAHVRGHVGEQTMGFAYRYENGWHFVDGPSGSAGHGTTQPGLDGLAYNGRTGELHILDNKAHQSTRNIASASAITRNLARNIDVQIAQVQEMPPIVFPHRQQVLRLLRQTRAALSQGTPVPGRVRVIVTNAAGASAGVTRTLRQQGVEFVDLQQPAPDDLRQGHPETPRPSPRAPQAGTEATRGGGGPVAEPRPGTGGPGSEAPARAGEPRAVESPRGAGGSRATESSGRGARPARVQNWEPAGRLQTHEGGAMLLYQLSLAMYRASIEHAAERDLAERMPQIRELTQAGRTVTVSIALDVPESVDLLAGPTGFTTPDQLSRYGYLVLGTDEPQPATATISATRRRIPEAPRYSRNPRNPGADPAPGRRWSIHPWRLFRAGTEVDGR